MSDSEPTSIPPNIAHKLSNASSRTLTEAEGGDDELSWRLELWSETSEMTYSLKPAGGPSLTLNVRVRGCTRGEQHLTHHRSAWKGGQEEFVSFLRDQLGQRPGEVREDLEGLSRRTNTMDCPIIDLSVFDSILDEQEDITIACKISRQFANGFEQEWYLTENGYEPNQWQRKVYQNDIEVALTGAQGFLTMTLWSTAPGGEDNIGLGEYTISPEEWTSDNPNQFVRVRDGVTLELRLARPLEDTDDPSEGSERSVRIAGMILRVPSIDWEVPFHPQDGYVDCRLNVVLQNTLLSPSFAQLEPIWVGMWTPRSRVRA